MVQDLWKRLIVWAQANAPGMLEDLNPGASRSDIDELQRVMGIEMPESLANILMLNNGESDGWPCKIFADHGAFLSTARIAEEWNSRIEIVEEMDNEEQDVDTLIAQGVMEVEGCVRPVMFDKSWIPFMDCNGDVFWAIDYAPAEGGRVGQVIRVDWECVSYKVIAPSFERFLESYVSELEAGRYPIVDGFPRKEG